MKKEFTKQLVRDIFADTPSANYDDKTPEDALQQVMYDILGTENPTANEMNSPKMHDFYTVVVEQIDSLIRDDLELTFPFAEYKNIGWGDQRSFDVMNPSKLKVQVSARANGDARVQKISDGKVKVETGALKIKVEIPFMKWAAGKMGMDRLRRKMQSSLTNQIKEMVYTAFFETPAFSGHAKFNESSTGSIDADVLYDLIDLVEGANDGAPVVTIASKKFIRNLVGSKTLSDKALEELRTKGYLEMADGNKFLAMEKVYDENFNAIFDDKTAIVVPIDDEKIVQIVEEGETIFDTQTNTTGNMAKEMLIFKQIGVSVVTGSYTGRYVVTA